MESTDWQTFFVKEQKVNIWGFAAHTVSVASIQHRHCSMHIARKWSTATFQWGEPFKNVKTGTSLVVQWLVKNPLAM